MDEMREKVECMQARIEEANQMIRDLKGTICILEEEKERLKRELDALKLDARFQYGKIAAYETVFKNAWRKDA